MNKTQIKDALKVAMKAGEKVKVETIRSILSAIQYDEVAQKIDELPEPGILEVLKRELKKRKEELEFAEKSGRTEYIEKLYLEIAAVEAFLPQQLSRDEIEKIITDLKNGDPNMNMGMIMKALKDGYSGQFDSRLASEIAKRVAG